ncbi:hypothetical protein [Plantactinospora sp. DSM 117369]
MKAIEKQFGVADQEKQLQTALTGLAGQVEAEAAKAIDPKVKAPVQPPDRPLDRWHRPCRATGPRRTARTWRRSCLPG